MSTLRALSSIATALVALVLPAVSFAMTVHVPPGNGTLQAAIDAAADGTTLVLAPGHYDGAVSITKPVRIKMSGRQYAIIDAGCTAAAAVTVAADHVEILGHAPSSVLSRGFDPILIQGGTDVDLAVTGSSKVKLSRIVVAQSCFTEQYGLDVQASERVTMSDLSVYTPAPVSSPSTSSARFGTIAPDAGVVVKRLTLHRLDNQDGIVLVQDAGGPTRHAGIAFTDVVATDLQLAGADGMRFSKSTFTNVTIDAASSANEFVHCSASSFADAGGSDCGAANEGFTLPPCN